MGMTILGCVVTIIMLKLLFSWVSRPRQIVHVHTHTQPPAQPQPVYYPVFVPQAQAAPAAPVAPADREAELHGMIDDYYRDYGLLP